MENENIKNNRNEFLGQCVFITGASRGIGFEIARGFAPYNQEGICKYTGLRSRYKCCDK